MIEALGLASLCAVPNGEWWMPLGWIGLSALRRIRSASPAMFVQGVAWLTLSIMTPFYHPYARLWLPLHSLGWIVIGGLFAAARTWLETAQPVPKHRRKGLSKRQLAFAVVCAVGLAITITNVVRSGTDRLPGPLEPTDSLRVACRSIPREVHPSVNDLRLYCRPAVTFYVSSATQVSLRIQPSLDRLLEPAAAGTWCLLDSAMTRQEHRSVAEDPRLGTRWVVARSLPSYFNLPTLLDVDPASCYGRSVRPVSSAVAFAAGASGGIPMSPQPPVRLWPDPEGLGLVTDVYELTMMVGYLLAGMDNLKASFELFVRKLPPHRSYLVFAGLEQAIGDILALAFTPEQIEGISKWPAFRHLDRSILDKMGVLRFEGDIDSMAEGTVVFPGETLLRVTAPLAQAQWVETYLLASIGYPTLVASKAARFRSAAQGRALFDYGARRGHGPHAGFLAARAAYIAGFAGTSQAEAARLLGIPPMGTMAHSWVQSFDSESESFQTFARFFPSRSTLLVDTYDTLEGVRLAAAIDPPIYAIRLDSGDLGTLAHQARAILDQNNRSQVKIFASGDLDEHRIAKLTASAAPIDGFGVGTELITSRDAPALGIVYKLVELEGHGKVKLSPGKRTYPMAKQVFRRRGSDGRFCGDHVTRADEVAEGEPLLARVVQGGRLARPMPSLDEIRRHCAAQLAGVPERLLSLDAAPDYPITYSDLLEADANRLMKR